MCFVKYLQIPFCCIPFSMQCFNFTSTLINIFSMQIPLQTCKVFRQKQPLNPRSGRKVQPDCRNDLLPGHGMNIFKELNMIIDHDNAFTMSPARHRHCIILNAFNSHQVCVYSTTIWSYLWPDNEICDITGV